MGIQSKYKSKPLDCWQKGKELRLNYYKNLITAREEGRLIVSGSGASCLALPAGLGDFVYFSGEPYGASIGYDPAFSLEAMEAAEARGYARDMCGYMRNYWGSMFLDRYYFGGPFPKPDFFLTRHLCDAGHGKWYQVCKEYYDVPLFVYEQPVTPPGVRFEDVIEYLASQLYDSIEWMEEITGRKYDDEKLIEASRNFFKSEALWGEICLLNQAIPAPLDLKSELALMPIAIGIRHQPEAVAFYEALRDEVKDRIANQIAAVADERCRLMTDLTPPWNFLKMFRYFEKYGVVFVGIWVYCINSGQIEIREDGVVLPAKTPEERNMPLNNRADALRAIALWHLESPLSQAFSSPKRKAFDIIALAKYWRCEGVVMHYNRGCPLCTLGSPEAKLELQKAGFPVAIYEGNFADFRELDESQVLDRLETFIQSLGLSKLED